MLFTSLQQLMVPDQIADGVELRLDYFSQIDKQQIRWMRKKLSCPFLFTLKKKQLHLVEELLAEEPEFIDLEWDAPKDFLEKIFEKYPTTKILLSYHNDQETPQNLDALFLKMQSPFAHAYKMATFAVSTLDALRMLAFVGRNKAYNISGICMGQEGQITRILGPIFGNFIDYAAPSRELLTAPGQLSLSDLFSIYHYHVLNPATAIYGLIGDPDVSISDLTHNALMRHYKWNAVYVKMRVKQEELKDFFPLAKECGIQGLSVTMPLKEAVLPFIDDLCPHAKKVQAVNTLYFCRGSVKGLNTDGIGALNALEAVHPVKEKKIVILGAGGAARAIASEASRRGAYVLMLNRTRQRAERSAAIVGCKGYGFGALQKERYDILINATSASCPVDISFIPNTWAMDVKTLPKMSRFLLQAESAGCRLSYGYEMFLYQAIEQFKIWLGPIEKGVFEKECLKALEKKENLPIISSPNVLELHR